MQDAKPKSQDSDSPEKDDRRIVIDPNDSVVQMITKAEQWCKQFLEVSEVDYTWCIRLGTTYDDCNENDAAIEQYKKVRDPLTLRRTGVFLTSTNRLPQFSKRRILSTRRSCEMCSKLSANGRLT